MLNFTRAVDLAGKAGQVIRGAFWVTERREKPLSNGRMLVQMTLGDGTGSVLGFVWSEYQAVVGPVAAQTPVVVAGMVRLFDGKAQLQIRQMRAVEASDVELASALLPVDRCPTIARRALSRLIELEKRLPEPLAGFLKRVLLDPAIGMPLLGCRGSVSHHHAVCGGLLVHCTELLPVAEMISVATLPQDPLAGPMAQLAYLLHDLGKLRSVGEHERPVDPLVLRHETMTVELLWPHLRWLDAQDHELALALRYIFEHLATPASARPKQAEYLVAEIAVFLDHCSAASFKGRDLAAFLKRSPISWGIAAKQSSKAANDDVMGNARAAKHFSA